MDGYKLIHYRKHCSTIIQSVRKSVLTTNVELFFKLLNKFPDCMLQALTLFVAQICTRVLLYLILFNSEWNNGFTTNWSWKYTMSHAASCDTNHESHYKLLLYFFRAFSEKNHPDQKSFLQTVLSFSFGISPAYKTRLLCTTSRRTIKT